VVSVLGQQLRKMILKDGYTAFAEGLHPGLIVVDAEDAMAHFGETNGGYKSHISGPDHTDGNWLRHRFVLSPSLLPLGVTGTRKPWTEPACLEAFDRRLKQNRMKSLAERR
jgi:hypothetical protein